MLKNFTESLSAEQAGTHRILQEHCTICVLSGYPCAILVYRPYSANRVRYSGGASGCAKARQALHEPSEAAG